jgi:hypothetical protein
MRWLEFQGASAGVVLDQFYAMHPGLLSFTVNVEECARWLGVVLDPRPDIKEAGWLELGTPPRIVYRAIDSHACKRWTIAQALGHLLGPASHSFAVELLLPSPWVIERWNQGDRSLPHLSRLFAVSERVLLARLQQLGLQ